nr:SLATT domain-containing protein [Sedimentibacter sp.]
MERNSQNSQGYKLESQIREAYGRVTYTQTCHDKIISRLLKTNDRIKVWQIVLSAITTSGFIVAIFTEDKIASILGAIISLLLLVLNSYTKNFNLIEMAQEHKVASDSLWKIREEYVSLLTDFDILEPDVIMRKRDELQDRTSQVYSNSPRTDGKSYAEAQKALKNDEEQTFSENEIDIMLPNSIRRSNRDMNN